MIIKPDIPVVFKGKFPSDYINDVDGWGYSREEILKNKGKLLTMDIDFTREDQCSLNCPHCYSHDGAIDQSTNPLLTFDEMIDVIREGKELGLKSIKLLGRGEHTEHPRLIEFLEKLRDLDVKPLMFTKGHVIGDDSLAEKYHSHRGIKSGEELVAKLYALNVSVLLGFRSFDTKKQDQDVGNFQDYSLKRNRALKLLVNQGFNNHNPTRIGLMALPIKKDNVNEVFDIYVYGKERNMHICVAPLMVSGRSSNKVFREKNSPLPEELIELYTQIYLWNIKRGVQTLEQLKEEGVSAYAGSRPCQQIGCGLYVTLFGDVYMCPGDDSEKAKFGNIREQSLKDIWKNSPNYERAGTFNCHCPAKDGKTIPAELYSEVIKRVEERIGKMPAIQNKA